MRGTDPGHTRPINIGAAHISRALQRSAVHCSEAPCVPDPPRSPHDNIHKMSPDLSPTTSELRFHRPYGLQQTAIQVGRWKCGGPLEGHSEICDTVNLSYCSPHSIITNETTGIQLSPPELQRASFPTIHFINPHPSPTNPEDVGKAISRFCCSLHNFTLKITGSQHAQLAIKTTHPTCGYFLAISVLSFT